MKAGRLHFWCFLGVAVLMGIGFAAHAWYRAATIRAAWIAAVPARPDVTKWPEEFRRRLSAAESRLSAATPDVAALGELARLYHANGFLREAEQAYRALLVFDPAEPRWPHLLAALLSDYGRLDEALPLLEKTVALAPAYLPARLRLADARVKLNRSDAAAAYRAILEVDSRNPHALLGLARLELDAGRLPNARAKLEEIATSTPDFSAAHSLLATVLERMGETTAAEAQRELAVGAGRFRAPADAWTDALVDECYDVYRLQVIAAGRVGRDALPVLERALALAPDNPGNHRQLGKILFGLGEYAPARDHLEKAVALEPREPAAYLDLVAVLRATKDLPAGLRLLETGLAQCPPDAGLHYEYALALLATRRPEEAVTHLEAARRLSPEKPLAARDLISTYFRLNRESDAARVLDESLALHPEFPPFLVMAARYRIMKNDAAAAEVLIARAKHAGALASDLGALASDYQRRFGRTVR
jgi:tetratricopeptide (TPR) repeat protein